VQTGRDLVQAAPTGFSTAVDSAGRVLVRSGLGNPDALMATLSLRDGKTAYDDTGALPVLVLAALALVAGWIVSLRPRHKRW
jgi:apolipoprotein N-acyltransferase